MEQMKEPLRYLENAKEILKKSSIEDDIYLDKKYVRQAMGAAYIGILEAINELLLQKGYTKKELPKKVEEYEKALKREFGAYNGRLLREFDMLYDTLHIWGYYRGTITSVLIVKDALKLARAFIEKLSRAVKS
ncbi:MAG: DUF5618 family protein [bacterium]